MYVTTEKKQLLLQFHHNFEGEKINYILENNLMSQNSGICYKQYENTNQ